MKRKKSILIIIVMSLISFFFFGMLIGEHGKVTTSIEEFIYMTDIPQTEQEIIQNCDFLNIRDTSNCLVRNIKTFYKYNETEGYNYSLKEMIEKGGDCTDYAYLYKRLGDELGFYSNTILIRVSSEDYHRMALLSDDTGYCLIDQKYVCCIDLKSDMS